jgi:RNA polymerase sigma factor (sigma-70 family)
MQSTSPLAALVRRVTPALDAVADAELLDRFVRSADQAAFELLVWRHGAMVWGVCRRMLAPDLQAAEDACQSTFVALACHAARLRHPGALAAWLHRVAVRASTALGAIRKATRALPLDALARSDPAPDPARSAADVEVRALLDTGLNRLPDRFRVPFVMCELEGHTNAEVAAALGCPVGTVESRLTRARQKLRQWLQDRGVVPAVALAAVAVPESAWAAMQSARVGATPSVKELAARAIPRALGAKLRAAMALGLVLAVSAVGLGLALGDAPKPPEAPPAKSPDLAVEPVRAARNGAVGKPAAPVPQRKEADELPLPRGAVARLGSGRLRHGACVTHVCFAPDGERIASVGQDSAVRVWDRATGKQLFAVNQPESGFIEAAFASGGKTLFVVGRNRDRNWWLWRIDVGTGTVKAGLALDGRAEDDPRELRTPGAGLVRFSPDGSRLALGSWKTPQVVVTDTETGKALWTVKIGDEIPSAVEFTADGEMVAVATRTGTVRLFEAGKPAGVLKAGAAELTGIAVSPKGDRAVAYNTKRELIAWDRATGKVLWTDKHLGGDGIWPVFSPDGKLLVRPGSSANWGACTVDPTDGVSPVPGGKKGACFASMGPPTCLAFQPDGKAVVFGTRRGTICLFDPITCRPITPSADPADVVGWMRFTPDGKTVYGFAGEWFAWEIPSGLADKVPLARPEGVVKTGQGRQVTNTGYRRDPWRTDYHYPLSPDGKRTIRVKRFGEPLDSALFEICNAATGAIEYSHVIKEPGFALDFADGWMEFTPDGKAFIGSDGNTLVAWSIDTGTELFQLPVQDPQFGRAFRAARAFSADGRVLAVASENVLRVFDLKAAKELAKFDTGTIRTGTLSLSADGGRVAVGRFRDAQSDLIEPNARDVAVVWDVASGKELLRVSQQDASGLVALSPDGRALAVPRSSVQEVRIWEVASGTQRFRFRHDHCDNPINALAFAPDGRTLATASFEAPIYLWDMTTVIHSGTIVFDAREAWDELAMKDASKAFAAFRRFWSNPDKVVAFLKERTKDWVPGMGDADRLRIIRVVEFAEGIDTPEAKELLESWAKGTASKVLASEAKAALARTKLRAR